LILKSPNGAKSIKPGAPPLEIEPRIIFTLKERVKNRFNRPFRAHDSFSITPGRCPGLLWISPRWGFLKSTVYKKLEYRVKANATGLNIFNLRTRP